MKRFRNILVGIDLSQGDHLVGDQLSPHNVEAMEKALWLAKANGAQVRFFTSLDVSSRAQQLITERAGLEETVTVQAQKRLEQFVLQAVQADVSADCRVVFGTSWIEIIRQVLRDSHDLVIVGTRHVDALQGTLLGNTGIKLMRKCPCPVWVTQARPDHELSKILVAHDLTPVGDRSLEFGGSMAEMLGAKLHVLHAMEDVEFGSLLEAEELAAQQSQWRDEAKSHIAAQLAQYNLAQPATTHLVTGSADVEILKCIEQHGIDLLVMGTIARSGIPGLIMGNTAERLLSRISCSVLAVKPEGFVSPITLS